MRLQVGKKQAMRTSVNPVTKEIEIMQNGNWVPAKNVLAPLPSANQPWLKLGIFEPIEVSKEKLSDLLLYLNSENLGYQYHIEKQGSRYYII